MSCGFQTYLVHTSLIFREGGHDERVILLCVSVNTEIRKLSLSLLLNSSFTLLSLLWNTVSLNMSLFVLLWDQFVFLGFFPAVL